MASSAQFIVNDAPYGKARACKALLLPGARRTTLAELAEWTLAADQVLVF